jgi:hypothetical protein
MADPIVNDPIPVAEGDSSINQPETPTTPDFQAELEKAKAELEEKFKTEIAGLNRKNSEIAKELKQKELEGKSEAEQVEALRKEKEDILKEVENLNRSRIVDKELDSAGLPLDFAKRIIGKDETEIAEDIKAFKTYIDELVKTQAQADINSKLGGSTPEGGAPPSETTLDEKIQKAQAAGDFVTVMALKDQKKLLVQ